jgi:integrase/recombinase XerD
LPVKLKSAVCNIESTQNSSKVNDTFSGLTIYSLKLVGPRSKELAALKVKDVYENGEVKYTLRLLAGYTKGEKHRDLALANPEVIKAIQATVVAQENQCHRINPDVPLFRSNRGGSFSANSMRRVLKTIYIDAGYPDASFHSGCRSMITRLAEKGIDVNSIRIIAGHSSLVNVC